MEYLIVGIVVAIGLFLLFRELVCWYFRLTKIEEQLSCIIVLLGGEEKAKEIIAQKNKQKESA
jgi:multisubunit Na+/H+ antiporter MnhC subunit